MKKKRRIPKRLIVILVVVCLLLNRMLSIIAINVFLFMDNLLAVSKTINPVIMWIALGLFTGLVYGAVVAYKKYRLSSKLIVFPAAALVLFIALMFIINKPLQSQNTVVQTGSVYGYGFISRGQAQAGFPVNQSNTISYLLDSNDNTCWLTSSAVGDTIGFGFEPAAFNNLKDVKCTGFRIKNGNCKSDKLWKNYSRAKKLTIHLNGIVIQTVPVSDYAYWTDIRINPVNIAPDDRLTVEINAIYQGKKNYSQTAITELVPIIEYVAVSSAE
ncbi:NADase-type glycan-binding domain-containing protein [Foetidibacter luteolus]|uniref:NADase-type glycan-binding domain-containing protein n=1 Tax=Foetidibacter luteolus TaxID=2608880 RepID=UPI00129B77A5|nr:hypothetical protein [Foetidibacter luteolus]